jgi:two-component system cell cycle response regulator
MKSFSVDIEALLTVAAGIFDGNGVLLQANRGFLRLLPQNCADAIGTRVGRFFIQPAFATLAAGPDGHGGYTGLFTIGDPSGKVRTLRGRLWRDAEVIRLLAEYDIIELERLNDTVLDLNHEFTTGQDGLARANVALKQREARGVEASLCDALTGVGNRRKLEQALESEIAHARRTGLPLTAIMLDVDHFKRINDEWGHGTGDRVLIRLGELLRSRFRPNDTVTRFGGEEFIILLPGADLQHAAAKAELIKVALATEVIAPLTQSVTASFGVAELASNESADTFLGRTDKALYCAKEAGRNRVIISG